MITVTNIGPNQAPIFDLKFKKQPTAFVRVHHPSCGHCLEMEPELKKLHKLLLSDYKGNVGIFDVHAEAAPHITATSALKSIDGYPTIMTINNNKSSLYHGDRSSDDMLNFCLQNLNLEKILKVYNGGKKFSKFKYSRKYKKEKKTKKNNKKNTKKNNKKNNKKLRKSKVVQKVNNK